MLNRRVLGKPRWGWLQIGAAVLSAGLYVACVGEIGGIGDGPLVDPEGEGSCSTAPTYDVPMHRITPTQFAVLVTDLFGDEVVVADTFPAPLDGYPYSTYADANPVAQAQVKPIMEAAEAVAMQVVDQVPACAGDETGCASDYFTDLATRAFRRPVSPDELAVLMDVYAGARAESDHAEAVGIAVFALLQMPQFLYAIETQPAAGAENTVLDNTELAQRMALLYWNGLPDAELLAADLTDAGVRRQQAARLLADNRGRTAISKFVREWLMVDGFRATVHSPELQDALAEELQRNIDDALLADNGIELLLTSSHTHVNSVLETFYGLPAESSGPTDWHEVDLDPEVRVGVLTHPILMARFAHGDAASPILRGKFVRLNLLCGQIAPPPPGATDQQASLTPADATPREKAEARLEHPVCGTCHALMDPIGFGFEAFDGTGTFHSDTSDTAGTINPPSTLAGDFDGVRELGEQLAESPEVQACFAKHWVRYATGRTEENAERCSMDALSASLVEQSITIQDLFASFAETRAFAERKAGE